MLGTKDRKLLALSIGSLGVVYGDIGTSPLYAMRASLNGLPLTPLNVLGVLSLIFWSLILIISIKYLGLILSADNEGEGGILALFALLKRYQKRSFQFFFIIAIIGSTLLLGDGMITPAISVLSAIEGLNVISPAFSYLVIPLTILILLLLFWSQYHGAGKIGRFFGPIIFLWFLTIGTLGIYSIIHMPIVLKAINPYYGFEFFYSNGFHGYVLLGGVFLVVTGGEALYADLGHFGKKAIRLSWFFVVLPGLVLNYFGQGAFLLVHPGIIRNPFYGIAPDWFQFPLLILATMATIIASQAVISATFSLAKQSILLDLSPHLRIVQTSAEERGQVYVPVMNFILMVGTITLVILFQSASALAHAYGIAVNLVMLTVTLLVIEVAKKHWKWSALSAYGCFIPFLIIDLLFLGSNSLKIETGGWFPLVFALFASIIMVSWYQGVSYLRNKYYLGRGSLEEIIDQLHSSKLKHTSGTNVFIADRHDQSGGSLMHYLKLNQVIPKHVIILDITIRNRPFIPISQRFELKTSNGGIHRLTLHYGFMQTVHIPHALIFANINEVFPFKIDVDAVSYFLETINVRVTRRRLRGMSYWQKKIFVFLLHTSLREIQFYQLPYNRTAVIGTYCEM